MQVNSRRRDRTRLKVLISPHPLPIVRRALTVFTPSKLDPPGALYHKGWDRAYYDQTAQEETMMAFTAMLSELYDAFRRKIGADELPAKTAAEAVVIEDARFRGIDRKFDALNHTM